MHTFILYQGGEILSRESDNNKPYRFANRGDYKLVCSCGFKQEQTSEAIWQSRDPRDFLRDWVHEVVKGHRAFIDSLPDFMKALPSEPLSGGMDPPRGMMTSSLSLTRPQNSYSLFEQSVEKCVGDWIRADHANAASMWCALANNYWFSINRAPGTAVLYTFRSAGDLIAAIRKEGNYINWYACGTPGTVDPFIEGELMNDDWYVRPARMKEW